MYFGIQTLPNIFIDNDTKHDLLDLHFFIEGSKSWEEKVKKVKSNERKMLTIYNRNMVGEKKLYMQYKNEQYEIFKLTKDYWSNILVKIDDVSQDNRLSLTITPNFSL
ncbi:hypothetical protein [Bacillus sp. FJAT-49736]|uniref:hypothetical protein n=1 Tax=Bacillus sp. FJAT-49736 TaxID=2833582 RepID=UPI001BCA22D0|nr:hypothetical protein [Bacillus sp. FJAT-49736]MBS4172679.1 hypothetical protein [Bacillus sp. FJAT-49736]